MRSAWLLARRDVQALLAQWPALLLMTTMPLWLGALVLALDALPGRAAPRVVVVDPVAAASTRPVDVVRLELVEIVADAAPGALDGRVRSGELDAWISVLREDPDALTLQVRGWSSPPDRALEELSDTLARHDAADVLAAAGTPGAVERIFAGGEVHFVSVEGEEEVILTETWRNTGGFVVALLWTFLLSVPVGAAGLMYSGLFTVPRPGLVDDTVPWPARVVGTALGVVGLVGVVAIPGIASLLLLLALTGDLDALVEAMRLVLALDLPDGSPFRQLDLAVVAPAVALAHAIALLLGLSGVLVGVRAKPIRILAPYVALALMCGGMWLGTP
ncbi:MAG: hypothetical protein H6744_21945, partial [Deltaproteobacteria bacterium]|nr:hypothetical protein [Deltaproteobacteria bacterium]